MRLLVQIGLVRAGYGEEIVATLSRHLTLEFGRGFTEATYLSRKHALLLIRGYLIGLTDLGRNLACDRFPAGVRVLRYRHNQANAPQ